MKSVDKKRSEDFYKLFKNGSIGFAESYMDGDFSSSNFASKPSSLAR